MEAAGHPTTLLAALRDISYIHALRGDMEASRDAIERAAALAGRMADPGPAAYTRAQRAWVAALGGEEWAVADAALDDAVALSRQGSPSWYSSYPLIFRARLSLVEGRRAEARAAAEALALAAGCGDLQARRWASADLAALEILEGLPGRPGIAWRPCLSGNGAGHEVRGAG